MSCIRRFLTKLAYLLFLSVLVGGVLRLERGECDAASSYIEECQPECLVLARLAFDNDVRNFQGGSCDSDPFQ
jgi:hypothetical protein